MVRGSSVLDVEADKVPAKQGCSSTVQADQMSGKREREGSRKTKKYKDGGQRQGHPFANTNRTDRATQE